MAEQKTSSTELVQSEEGLQRNLKKALRAIDTKLRSLGISTTGETFKTNGSFKYNELDGNVVNIFTATDPGYLIKALSKMKRVSLDYEDTMTELGIKNYPICLWMGQHVTSWIHDLTIRVKIVVNQKTINDLNSQRNNLSQFLSNKEKLQSALSSVADLLKEE